MARKRAMKWNDLHLRPRIESITDDNVESNCSMTKKYSSKRSEFLRFNMYFCHVEEFTYLSVAKINKQNSDMIWQRYKLNPRNSLLLEEYFRVV